MNERVHAYLDGDLSISELTDSEAAEARRIEAFGAELRRQRGEAVEADFVSAVMSRIEAADAETAVPGFGLRRLADWVVRKRRISFAVRPVYAFAAIVLLIFAGLQWNLVSIDRGSTAAPADADPTVFVRFELSAPEAESVRLAGSFSGWSPAIDLTPIGNGRWMALVPLRPGVHDYAFRVDGSRWVTDPSAPRVSDGFGGFNSRLSLVVTRS